jgi:hypothetical protein
MAASFTNDHIPEGEGVAAQHQAVDTIPHIATTGKCFSFFTKGELLTITDTRKD